MYICIHKYVYKYIYIYIYTHVFNRLINAKVPFFSFMLSGLSRLSPVLCGF